jgi:hypothetical protein
MIYLYGTGLAYGVGTGIWIDVLAHSSDPAVGTIAPILFGAGVPLGFFLWDYLDTFRPGVPASMATGMWLGFAEGVAISSIQVATTGDQKRWDLSTAMTIPFITTTIGGVGGYFFGRWLEPDPRAVAFIAEGMAWGAGTGVMLGIGASADGRPGSEKSSGDGAAVGTLLGANIGIGATSALVIGGYQPSWQAQKWMWLGYVGGAAIPSLVYLAYIGSDKDPKHGLIANALGGVAGLTVAALIARNLSDDEPTVPGGPGGTKSAKKKWEPPFMLTVAPNTNGMGGGMISAFGSW